MQRTYPDAIIWLLDELCSVRAILVTKRDACVLESYKEKSTSYTCGTHWKYNFLIIARE